MSNLPYVTAHGNITRALDGIKKAAVPEKASGDFVKTILGVKGGSGDQITSYLKKIGFVDSVGTPTQLYKRFRNPTTAGSAAAEALRIAYKPLFDRNEYVYDLPEKELKGLIVEETGQAIDSNPVKMILSCFKALNAVADFEPIQDEPEVELQAKPKPPAILEPTMLKSDFDKKHRLNIGYNIHLNLPATDDIAVFNAIFKSLRENLLVDDD